jgi:hypothetical protein
MEGAFDDRNKWVRCWNCSHIVSLDKIGGDPERSGNAYYMDKVIPSQSPVMSGDPLNAGIMLRSLESTFVLVELQADGITPVPTYKNTFTVALAGCPFCGTTNLP